MTPSTLHDAGDAFHEYNRGKLEVRDGLVHLLAAGWAEYGPSFSAVDMQLRDKMPLAEFKHAVRVSVRATLKANDAALQAELAKLSTPNADKQFIRTILNVGDANSTPTGATVLAFPTRSRS